MKIVCDSCSAKYSIADEKVAGKVFKIRCKRCSEVIVVRGDQQQPEEDATRVYDSGGDAVWHVVVDGEQQGPFSPVQIGEMLTSAQIDWEAYIWREGFDNWLPARDVPELVEAVTGQGAGGYAEEAAPAEEEAPAEEVAYEAPAPAAAPVSVRTQAKPRSMGADPFADDGAGDGGLFGGGGGGDLFGGGGAAAANPFGGGHDDGVVASAPNPRVGSAQNMTGARNENSVLFSLKNLQALATGGNEGGGSGGSSSASPAPRAGFATGEGSGLIDIRALASATGLGSGSGSGDKDELLSMGGGQTGAFGSLGSPMLAAPLAAASEPEKTNTMLYVGFGVLTLVVLGMGGGMFYLLTKEPPPAQIVQVAAPVAAAPVAAAAAAAPAAEEPTEGEKAAAKAAEEAAAKEKADDNEGSSSRRRRASSGRSSSGSSSSGSSSGSDDTGSARSESAPTKAPARTGANATIDDLLGGALGGGGSPTKTKAAPAAPASNLPEQPSRDDVMNALRSVEDAVKACGGGQHGVAMAAITVAGSTGRVRSVNVSGQFQGTPVGSCVARAVRAAKFPKFSRPDFKVNFPFRI